MIRPCNYQDIFEPGTIEGPVENMRTPIPERVDNGLGVSIPQTPGTSLDVIKETNVLHEQRVYLIAPPQTWPHPVISSGYHSAIHAIEEQDCRAKELDWFIPSACTVSSSSYRFLCHNLRMTFRVKPLRVWRFRPRFPITPRCCSR